MAEFISTLTQNLPKALANRSNEPLAGEIRWRLAEGIRNSSSGAAKRAGEHRRDGQLKEMERVSERAREIIRGEKEIVIKKRNEERKRQQRVWSRWEDIDGEIGKSKENSELEKMCDVYRSWASNMKIEHRWSICIFTTQFSQVVNRFQTLVMKYTKQYLRSAS